MDHAVALVDAYLHVNGYLTVAEYPVLESVRSGPVRTATEIDLVGFRLPRSGGILPADRRRASKLAKVEVFTPDPALESPVDRADLILVEVKEGRAELNPAARDPAVLSAVLARFGRVAVDDLGEAVECLLRRGRTRISSGVDARLLAFGSTTEGGSRRGSLVVPLGHVVQFLKDHMREHWGTLRPVQILNRAFGFLTAIEKAERGLAETRQSPERHARARDAHDLPGVIRPRCSPADSPEPGRTP